MIIKPQYENYLLSSAFLWADNKILTKLEGFQNKNVQFKEVLSPYSNLKCFSSSFGQFVADSSISSATISTGVYINGVYSTPGQNGLHAIDYLNGCIYTSGISPTSITGEFCIKYINCKLADEPEEKILFETSYTLRSKTTLIPTGLQLNSTNYPILFIKNNGGFNEPLTFGGLEKTISNLRLIVLADSEYAIDSINSCFRDTCKTHIPLFNQSQFPFNHYGFFNSGSYNYNTISSTIINEGNTAFINEVYISKYNQSYVDLRRLNPNVFWSIIDFEIESHRYPRI